MLTTAGCIYLGEVSGAQSFENVCEAIQVARSVPAGSWLIEQGDGYTGEYITSSMSTLPQENLARVRV